MLLHAATEPAAPRPPARREAAGAKPDRTAARERNVHVATRREVPSRRDEAGPAQQGDRVVAYGMLRAQFSAELASAATDADLR